MLTFTLKKSRTTKRIRISVHTDGRVVVSAPAIMPVFLIRRFVNSKKDWIEQKLEYFRTHPQPAKRVVPRMNAENKKMALDLVSARLAHFNRFYNFDFNSITIRNQKSRWGSCSRKRNLNFNYKILFLTSEQQDYIVVHELCHLAQMNHGRDFWVLVAQQIPEYKRIRASLRKFQL